MGSSRTTAKIVTFDDFSLDIERGVLTSADSEFALRPKSLHVLRVLLDNAGRVVSKRELMDAVWPGSMVGDDTLTQSIGDIRRAIGARGSVILRTYPRRGYMLDADVIAKPEVETPTGVDAAEPARFRRTTSAAVAALMALCAFAYVVLSGSRSADTAPANANAESATATLPQQADLPVLAVVALRNNTDRNDLAYLRRSLAREVTLQLNRTLRVRTVGSSSALAMAATLAPRQIAVELNADFVLVGEITEADELLRFQFALYARSTDSITWRHSIDQVDLDALVVRRELASRLADLLGTTGAPTPRAVSQLSADAYHRYLRAKALLDNLNDNDARSAHELLKIVTQMEPDFAAAWRELARAQWRVLQLDDSIDKHSVRLLRTLLERAEKLDPTDAGTQSYIAWHEVDFNGSLDRGVERLSQALALNTYHEDALRNAISLSYASGEMEAAVKFARFALRYNTLCKSCRYRLVHALLNLGRLEEAMTELDTFAALYPGGKGTRARILLFSGRPEAALQAIKEERNPAFRAMTEVMAEHALGRDVTGRLPDTVALLTSEPIWEASMFAYIGENDKAFAALERYVSDLRVIRDGEVVRWNSVFLGGALHAPELRSLRTDRRWVPFVARNRLVEADVSLRELAAAL
ncbi:MAG: transcriptional regulator, partial [Pseudomonadota bacterium]